MTSPQHMESAIPLFVPGIEEPAVTSVQYERIVRKEEHLNETKQK